MQQQRHCNGRVFNTWIYFRRRGMTIYQTPFWTCPLFLPLLFGYLDCLSAPLTADISRVMQLQQTPSHRANPAPGGSHWMVGNSRVSSIHSNPTLDMLHDPALLHHCTIIFGIHIIWVHHKLISFSWHLFWLNAE